jgi:hypothetical protein
MVKFSLNCVIDIGRKTIIKKSVFRILKMNDKKDSEIHSQEQRKYEMNCRKALKKKLNTTEREEMIITVTGGGIKLEMNTGIYELFKYASEIFFSDPEMINRTKKTTAFDKKQNIIETKYNVSSEDKSCSYTLNLYHTRSSF